MEELLSALKQFEKRNNISTSVIIQSDESFGVVEFWSNEDLGSFDSYDDLIGFLLVTQYELDETGNCIKPCKLKPAPAERG